MDDATAVTEDRLLGGRVRLRQPRHGHRVGSDAVLLAAATEPAINATVVDLGAGTGAVGLMVGVRSPMARIVFVERDPWLVTLCQDNVRLNGLERRAEVIAADILAPAAERRRVGLEPAMADLLLTNPPFLEEGRSRASPDARRASAHALRPGGLADWIAVCADLLRPKGRLALIHRADRLPDCLAELQRAFGGIAVQAVHAHADEPAIRIIVTAEKGSRAPLRVVPPLILHGEDGRFTALAEAIHRGDRLEALGPRGRRSGG